jgi:hypothetical protein
MQVQIFETVWKHLMMMMITTTTEYSVSQTNDKSHCCYRDCDGKPAILNLEETTLHVLSAQREHRATGQDPMASRIRIEGLMSC